MTDRGVVHHRRARGWRQLAVVMAVVAAFLVVAPPAHAAFPEIGFRSAESVVSEAGSDVNVEVLVELKTGGSSYTSPLTFQVVDAGTGSAVAADFTIVPPPGGTYQFDDGIDGDGALRTVFVTIHPDSLDEAQETVNLAFASITNGDPDPLRATHQIKINDDGDPAPTVSISGDTVNEGDSASFDVTLSTASGQVVEVQYATEDGTATEADSDYSSRSGTLTFSPSGSLTQSITVPTGDDTKDESDEAFAVRLSAPVNTSVTGTNPATGTILDNDIAALSVSDESADEGNSMTFDITLSAQSLSDVTVSYSTANGTATAGSDYNEIGLTPVTFTPGQTLKTVTVTTIEDQTDELTESFTLNLSSESGAAVAKRSGTGTINDNDGPPGLTVDDAVPVLEGGPGMVFTIRLLPASGQTVRVDYSTADGTATSTSPSDYTPSTGFVEFLPGETSKQTSPIPITNDTTDEITETVLLNLSDPVNAAIADAQGSGAILDDDNVSPIVTFFQTLDQADNPMFQFGTGDTVKIRVNFTDPGIADAHSVIVNWGDGSAPSTFPIAPVGARSFEQAHTFAAEGFYQISASIADGDGGSGVDERFVTVSGPGVGAGNDTAGLVDPTRGVWRLYDAEGTVVTEYYYGVPGDYPFMGDWDGDGIETPGLYRQADGYVYLRNSNTQGVADIKFFFGNPGDVPIAGDFNGDGLDTVSIYRPSNQRFYIINKLGSNDGGLGAAEIDYVFGNPGDKPFVGDFDGDGIETVGLHRESTGLVYFRNSHTQGNADHQFIFGDPGDKIVAGDWNGDTIDAPAVYRTSDRWFYFRHSNTQGNSDSSFYSGVAGWIPVAGMVGL